MNEPYRNNEDIIIKIINSNLSDEYKLKYIKRNEVVISDISKIEELKENLYLIGTLIAKNKILFNINNINNYWCSIDEYDEEFVEYVDKNINDDNFKGILEGNIAISNTFINSSIVSDKVFEYALQCANKPITKIDENINREKVIKLINKDLVSITNENLNALLNNKFYDETVMLVNTKSDEQQDEAITMILGLTITPELIYKLINSNLSEENAKKLVNEIIDDVLIEKIDFDKLSVIEYVIDQGLSDININYICKNFKVFKLKDKFIEYLDINSKFRAIKVENLNPEFVRLTLSNPNVSVNSKIEIAIIKIENKANKDELVKVFSSIDDIAELADVWNNKNPSLDNVYKEQIGEALIKFGYATRTSYRGRLKIKERKKERKVY